MRPAFSGAAYTFTQTIGDPSRVETVKLPDEGTATFSLCTVDVVEKSTVERDILDIGKTILEKAKSIRDSL